MRCEVVAIGTELLLGQIVDSNSAWIGEQLALAGIDSHFQVKVGDNFGRIEACLRLALERSDAVICCGGLGPTQDDITREVIAHIMGAELRRDDAVVEKIREMFESRGRVMAENNKRQADVPIGASLIPQMPGTAPGLICPVGDKVIYAVPGVPQEMHEMVLGTILPDLRRRSGATAAIRSRILRTWGQSESGLAEILAERVAALEGSGNPTLAFQASGIEGIKVRITVKAADEAAAEAHLTEEEARIRAILGEIVFGADGDNMESTILKTLRARNLTLAIAEPLTAGLMATRLAEQDPEMEVFRGATVAGSGQGTEVSELAEAARQTFGTEIGLAALRAATAEQPGRVLLAIARPIGVKTAEVALPGDLRRMRNFTVISLLNFLRLTLQREEAESA